MSSGALVTNSGLRDADVTINGTSITPLPSVITPNRQARKTFSQTMNNRFKVDAAGDGDGLPDILDVLTFSIQYQPLSTSVADQALLGFLESLRCIPGPHRFVLWKMFRYHYTPASGQVEFYLPRVDARTKSYSGKATSGYNAIITFDNAATAPTVDYPGTAVTSATSVAAGHVSISGTEVDHPDSDANVTYFKFGTQPTPFIIDYHPLFDTEVFDLQTSPFSGDMPGREDKTLILVESN